jgi:ribosomal protein S18 acetylase RimI-like enzyme
VEYTDEIYNHYHEEADYAYIKSRIAKGKIFGGFINGELCGFIGTHEEGSIGILMVLPQYRHRGFAEELICYMINNILDKGQIPYSQISIDNEISIKLHKKLSFEISTDILYWFF